MSALLSTELLVSAHSVPKRFFMQLGRHLPHSRFCPTKLFCDVVKGNHPFLMQTTHVHVAYPPAQKMYEHPDGVHVLLRYVKLTI